VTVLAGAELSQVVPPGFYFQGRSAPVQLRNAARAFWQQPLRDRRPGRYGRLRSRRAREVSGILVTDSAIRIGGSKLGIGAYGFGFTSDGKFLIMDLSGKEILSVAAVKGRQVGAAASLADEEVGGWHSIVCRPQTTSALLQSNESLTGC